MIFPLHHLDHLDYILFLVANYLVCKKNFKLHGHWNHVQWDMDDVKFDYKFF
jgi:hypothetical protein